MDLKNLIKIRDQIKNYRKWQGKPHDDDFIDLLEDAVVALLDVKIEELETEDEILDCMKKTFQKRDEK